MKPTLRFWQSAGRSYKRIKCFICQGDCAVKWNATGFITCFDCGWRGKQDEFFDYAYEKDIGLPF